MGAVQACFADFDRDAASEMLIAGISHREIATRFGVSRDTVGRLRAARGIPLPRRSPPPLGIIAVRDAVVHLEVGFGRICFLDVVDAHHLGDSVWYARTGREVDPLYVRCNRYGRDTKLHRLICDAAPKQIVDHIDGDTLNNRRHNLRICSPAGNSWNRGMGRNNTSGYKGVIRSDGRWVAQIKLNGRSRCLGRFDDVVEAARAYDRAAIELFGEFARPNFPQPSGVITGPPLHPAFRSPTPGPVLLNHDEGR